MVEQPLVARQRVGDVVGQNILIDIREKQTPDEIVGVTMDQSIHPKKSIPVQTGAPSIDVVFGMKPPGGAFNVNPAAPIDLSDRPTLGYSRAALLVICNNGRSSNDQCDLHQWRAAAYSPRRSRSSSIRSSSSTDSQGVG